MEQWSIDRLILLLVIVHPARPSRWWSLLLWSCGPVVLQGQLQGALEENQQLRDQLSQLRSRNVSLASQVSPRATRIRHCLVTTWRRMTSACRHFDVILKWIWRRFDVSWCQLTKHSEGAHKRTFTSVIPCKSPISFQFFFLGSFLPGRTNETIRSS